MQIFDILNIDPLKENRCCGLRKDGMPCNNIVSIASRQSAFAILQRCDEVRLDRATLQQEFENAASLLLCKRWHQNQWSEVTKNWLRAHRHHRRAAASSAQTIQPQESSRPVPNTESLHSAFDNLLNAVLNSSISNDEKVAILRTANTASVSTPASNSTGISQPRASRSSRDTRAVTIRGTEVSLDRLTPPIASTAVIVRSRLSPTHPPSSALVRTTPTPLRTSSITRQTHSDCGVCFEPYDEAEDGGYWECSECQNRTHLTCHTQWSLSSPEPTRCIYCRVVVPPVNRQLRITST